MKLAHSNKENLSRQEWLQKARELESNGDYKEAAAAYEKVIRLDPLNEEAYNRLMIVYRKLRQPGKELTVIRKGIKTFQEFYTSPRKTSRKISSLSLSLMKASGLADTKGKPLYEPEPIGKWKKREAVVKTKRPKSKK